MFVSSVDQSWCGVRRKRFAGAQHVLMWSDRLKDRPELWPEVPELRISSRRQELRGAPDLVSVLLGAP